jgi:site-specific recombinase XerD
MAKIRLIQDKRKSAKSKKGELYPLALNIYHQNQKRLRLGYYIPQNAWDEKALKVKKSGQPYISKPIAEVNEELINKLQLANKVLSGLGASLHNLDIRELTVLIKKSWDNAIKSKFRHQADNQLTLSEWSKILIERKLLANKAGTAKWYADGVAALTKFNQGEDINLIDIDVTFLKNFEAYHLAKGNSKNGIGAYLRAIRAIYNAAIEEDAFEPFRNPFLKYKIPSTSRTKKKAIPKESFLKIRDLEYEFESPIWHVKNYVLVMFNCRGMNLIDLAQLRIKSIFRNRVFYGRSKTGDSLSVAITPELENILAHYTKGKKKNDFIFPIGYDGSSKDNALYRARRKIVNKYLKQIGRDAGIEGNFTTYYIRHSWATIAKNMGISTEVISEGLGHKSLNTTEVYLKSFDNNTLDEANARIVS